MKFKNETYDKLKFIVMVLGYVATFILTLTDVWGFTYGTRIAATVSALGILLGAILTDSSKKYNGTGEEDEQA